MIGQLALYAGQDAEGITATCQLSEPAKPEPNTTSELSSTQQGKWCPPIAMITQTKLYLRHLHVLAGCQNGVPFKGRSPTLM